MIKRLMTKRLMIKRLLSGLALGACLAASPAAAAGFDGSAPLICASIETYQCETGADCLRGTAESINVPQFIRLDFQSKLARATRVDGEERTSAIEMIVLNEGELILQGVQGGLGWSLAIAQESGKMTLTAAGDEMGFVVFGACTTL